MILRFSERVAIDETGEISFGAHLGKDGAPREAVLRTAPKVWPKLPSKEHRRRAAAAMRGSVSG